MMLFFFVTASVWELMLNHMPTMNWINIFQEAEMWFVFFMFWCIILDLTFKILFLGYFSPLNFSCYFECHIFLFPHLLLCESMTQSNWLSLLAVYAPTSLGCIWKDPIGLCLRFEIYQLIFNLFNLFLL